MPSKIFAALFIIALTLPGIGFWFFPDQTFDGFSMPDNKGSTRHLARLLGIRIVTLGTAMALSKPDSGKRRTLIQAAVTVEVINVVAGALSYWYGDMGGAGFLQSSAGTLAIAALGFMAL